MDVGAVLVDILVVLLAAKVAAELAERIGLPAVVAEILAGVLIGPSVLGVVSGDETLRVLGEIGVILLLLEVGLQMDLSELGAVGRASVLVATVGVVAPMALGVGGALAAGHDGNTALFVGAALTATSVGITARVFGDLRALATTEARTVLGAAVADDVMGLVVLTVVVRVVTEGSVSALSVAGIVAVAVGFLVVASLAGLRLAPPLFAGVDRMALSRGTLIGLALAFTLGFAELASAAGLAPIVGAFVAGLALSRSAQSDRIRRELTPVGHLFVPVFFLQIGIDADIGSFARPSVLGLAGILLAAAVAGKLVSPLGAMRAPGDKLLIGLGMLPRGEVGLIFATIGLREGVLGQDIYAALLLVVLATTLVTPPLLRWRLSRLRAASAAATALPAAAKPEGGWLVVEDGVVELAAQPPPTAALEVALDAAAAVASARPGPGLLDWLSIPAAVPRRWDPKATAAFLRLLERGNTRSWRLLDTTGGLDRAAPELAEALRQRGADPFELDPTHALRWATLDELRSVRDDLGRAGAEHTRLEHPDWLLLAGLLVDSSAPSPVPLARGLVQRLGLGAAAEQHVAFLVDASGLLWAASRRARGLTEEAVLQLASHLDRPERARALLLLSLATGRDADEWEKERLFELHDLVQAALAHPELTGLQARNLVDRRRSEAARLAGDDPEVGERIATAPRAYLLSCGSRTVARHAALIEPLPPAGRARVAVRALPDDDSWAIDVVSRDRPGLLAVVSGVVAEAGFDMTAATIATWGDGAALESFRVRGADTPDPMALTDAVEAAFLEPLESDPLELVELGFDDEASPWHTLCDVRAADRPGLLHAIAAAFAAAGAAVHAAEVGAVDGKATGRFELTDGDGRKLGPATKRRVETFLASGVAVRRRWVRARRLVP